MLLIQQHFQRGGFVEKDQKPEISQWYIFLTVTEDRVPALQHCSLHTQFLVVTSLIVHL